MEKMLEKNIEFIFASVLDQTKLMENIFEKVYNNNDLNKTMSIIRLVDVKAVESSKIKKHFIFLLDESGSMSGTPWNELKVAYNNFIDVRQKSQSIIDYVSVITYDSSVRRLFTRESVLNAKNRIGNSNNGGTYFTPAFQNAQTIVAQKSEAQPIIIFMSDGGAEDPTAYIRDFLMNPYQGKGLKIYSVAFGSADLSILNKIAAVGGTQLAKTATNGIELSCVFNAIGTDESKVLNQMVSKFAEHVGKEIGNKLVLEYL
jgi:uncharacterized protein YegL